MKSVREIQREADALDLRRRHQIDNQVASINRLLNGGTYEGEIQELHAELAKAQAERDEALEKLRRYEPDGS